MAAYWDGYGYYEPTKPIEVKGGIKAKSGVEVSPRAGGQSAGSKPSKVLIWEQGWTEEKAMPVKDR
jgi:hypothetical protein